ncbi:MAG: ribonuclease P protein component [Treponema sp.]|nr:ribonuclease P protein component [Treponema sp.]
MVSFRFKWKEHLKGRNEIREVFNRGRCLSGPGAKLFVLKNDLRNNRICFTLSRKFGNAVERNRAKRLGREVYRLTRPRLKDGYDLVLLVYPPAMDFDGRMRQLQSLFTRAGLFKE